MMEFGYGKVDRDGCGRKMGSGLSFILIVREIGCILQRVLEGDLYFMIMGPRIIGLIRNNSFEFPDYLICQFL